MHYLKKLLESGVLSDVSFYVGEELEIFKAHKCILAVRSHVFRVMFDGNFKESSTTEEEETRIQIPDSTPAAFKEFLGYIYLDEEIPLNEENWAPILYLADKYDLPQLKKRSVEFVSEACNDDTVFGFYSEAWRHSVSSHVLIIKKYIGWYTLMLLDSDSFLKIHNNEILNEILSLDELYCYEIEVFRAAIRWASFKIPREEKDGPELRRILGPALFAIRFPIISSFYFEEEVIPSGIITKQEIINIFYKRDHLYEGYAIEFPSHSRIEFCDCDKNYKDVIYSKQASIEFQADKKIKIHGYEVKHSCSATCMHNEGKFQLKLGKEILREENIVHQYSTYMHCPEFYFHSPVIIEPHTRYTASLEFNSAIEIDKYNLPYQTEKDGVKWTFSDTNPEEGNISRIHFNRLG